MVQARARIWTANIIGLMVLAVLSALVGYVFPFGAEGIGRLIVYTAIAGIVSLLTWQEWNTIVNGAKDYLALLGGGVVLTIALFTIGAFVEEISLEALLAGKETAWHDVGNIVGVGRWSYGPLIIGVSLSSLVREGILHMSKSNLTSPSTGRAKAARR